MLRRLSLSTRLTLALSSTALMVFGGVGVWQLTAERDDLRRAVERELLLLGRSLQVAFGNALRDRQSEDVEETLRELEGIDPTVDIFVYDRLGSLVAASSGAIERAEWRASLGTASGVHFRMDADPPRAELVLPLEIGQNDGPASLVLVRPLRSMVADLDATRRRIVLSVGAFLLLLGVLTMALSRYWVGLPLARMNAHMRRVRAGDLSRSATLSKRDDEVGRTLEEFEALVRDLADARARLETEGEVRRQIELALREVDKLATVGQLAAGLAHEIGSPLQVLEGRIATLAPKAPDPETGRLAGILREQTQRITRIVARLIGVARRRPVPSASLDPGRPVRAVVDLLEGEARRRGVALVVTIPDSLPLLRGDPDALQQLALNLLRNALDATGPGGTIEVRMYPVPMKRPDDGKGIAVRIMIADTGRGMSSDVCLRAFEPFFTTRSPQGTGLGLAVVRGIVDDHCGRIDVHSEEHRGTTFIVDLPAAAQDEGEQGPP